MSDEVFSDVDQKIATLIRVAQEVGQSMRLAAQQAAYTEVSTANQVAQREQLALRAARPYLSEGTRDRWWNEAEPEDAAHMMGLAERFREADPTAEAVWRRGVRECKERWGIDMLDPAGTIPRVLAASDEELSTTALPVTVTDQTLSPDQIRSTVIETMDSQINASEITAAKWESIVALVENETLPSETRDKLITKVLPGIEPPNVDAVADIRQIVRDSSLSDQMKKRLDEAGLSVDMAQQELGDARSTVDALQARSEELAQAVQNGNEAAAPELASTQTKLSSAQRDEILAEKGLGETTVNQAHFAAELRDEGFPIHAAEGLKQTRKPDQKAAAVPKARTSRVRTRVR